MDSSCWPTTLIQSYKSNHHELTRIKQLDAEIYTKRLRDNTLTHPTHTIIRKD